MTAAVVLDSLPARSAVGWNPDTRSACEHRRADETWLDAAPFRAHVGHLMSASGLSAREVAALTRVSVRLIRRLVGGREGRPVRRIDPLSARRLYGVTLLDATMVRSQVVPAGPARATVLILTDRGRSTSSLGRLTGLTPADILRLADGSLTTVCQIVELRLSAALIELDGTAEAVESITASRSDLADAA